MNFVMGSSCNSPCLIFQRSGGCRNHVTCKQKQKTEAVLFAVDRTEQISPSAGADQTSVLGGLCQRHSCQTDLPHSGEAGSDHLSIRSRAQPRPLASPGGLSRPPNNLRVQVPFHGGIHICLCMSPAPGTGCWVMFCQYLLNGRLDVHNADGHM